MKKRFQEMVSNLKQNPHVKITQLVFEEPASSADIEVAMRRTNGVLPESLEAFYREELFRPNKEEQAMTNIPPYSMISGINAH